MTVSPLGDLPPTLWFCCPGPVDINIVAKCNACLSGPCKNNGTCSQDPVERYRCACPYGYKVRRETPPPPLRARSALRPADPPAPQGSLGNSMAQVTPEAAFASNTSTLLLGAAQLCHSHTTHRGPHR